MAIEQIISEAIKLLVQLGGALLIAWLAVKWALRRYKTEKHWERKLAAYTDVVAAIGALQRVIGAWLDEDAVGYRGGTETDDELKERYWGARRRIGETSAMARLLLAPNVAEIIDDLETEVNRLDHARFDSFAEKIAAEWKLLTKVNDRIIEIGREDLGI